MRATHLLLPLALVALWGTAHAQAINRCTIDGRLVIQAAPCALEPRPMAVTAPAAPSHSTAATTATPAAPKKKMLADLLRERDGNPGARPAVYEAQGDGANVLRARMGAV